MKKYEERWLEKITELTKQEEINRELILQALDQEKESQSTSE